jgi:hypothetical protein
MLLNANGENPKVVQELLRHASLKVTTDVYTVRARRIAPGDNGPCCQDSPTAHLLIKNWQRSRMTSAFAPEQRTMMLLEAGLEWLQGGFHKRFCTFTLLKSRIGLASP